jgi:hypothetical protein
VGRQGQETKRTGAVIFEGRKYLTYEYFERHYYRLKITDYQYTQVMKFYTDTFGELDEFVWVDFVRAAKFFILKHYHWPIFRTYHEFMPDKMPQKLTYGDLAEFDIPLYFAIELSKKQLKQKVLIFDYNCAKAFDRAVEDTI